MLDTLYGTTTWALKGYRRSRSLTIADAKFHHLVKTAMTKSFHVKIYFPPL